MDIDANADIDTEPRPNWWERLRAIPRGVWVLGLILLALLTPLLVRTWFLSQVPDIGDPFDVAAFCKSMEVPQGNDARTAYRSAARTYFSDDEARASKLGQPVMHWHLRIPSDAAISAVFTGGWDAADDTVKEWVAAHEPSLLEWKRAVELNHVWFNPAENLLWSFEDHDLNFLHYLEMLSMLRGRKCEAEQDFAGAFQLYRAGILARDQLWGAPWSNADDLPNVLHWAALPAVSAAQLRTALAQLRRDRAARQPASHAIKVEYVRAMNSLKKRDGLATAIRYRSGNQSPMDTQTTMYLRFVYWVCGEPERTRRLYQHLVANQLRGVDQPAPTHPALHTPTSTLIYNDDAAVPLPAHHLSAARIAEAIRMSGISFHLESSASGQLLRDPISEHSFREARAFPVLFELALILQIHRREHGTFPAQLADLVPGYIDAVPVDPCDPKALPVRYRLDNPNQATLWSVGGNDVDDNGIRWFDAVLVVRAPAVVNDGSVPETGKD